MYLLCVYLFDNPHKHLKIINVLLHFFFFWTYNNKIIKRFCQRDAFSMLHEIQRPWEYNQSPIQYYVVVCEASVWLSSCDPSNCLKQFFVHLPLCVDKILYRFILDRYKTL